MTACDVAAAEAALRALEEELLDVGVRKNEGRLMELLAEDFREFGSSGRVFKREQIISLLSEEKTAVIDLKDFIAEGLAEGCVLVTYRAGRVEEGVRMGESLRSSIWMRRDGRWQMVFHQGTKVVAS